MKGWDQKAIDRLEAKGIGVKETGHKPKVTIPKPKKDGKKKEAYAFITGVLKSKKIDFVYEYKFLTNRKFKFDICILQFRIGIEYEGLVSTGEKGGHQTKAHYTKNCTKYNLAAINGWVMLRYTCRNFKEFEQNIIDFLLNYKAV